MSLGEIIRDHLLWHRQTADIIDQAAFINGGVSTNVSDAYTISLQLPITRLVNGESFHFQSNHTSTTTTPTLTIAAFDTTFTAIGPYTIVATDGSALSVGDITQDANYIVIWNESGNHFRLIMSGSGGGSGGDFWSLLGNAGTVAGTNFLGTTDNVAHDIRVNNVIARRTDPNATCPNIYNGKWSTFTIAGSQIGYTIGGGSDHEIDDGYFSTIGGGLENLMIPDAVQPDGGFSTIAGGWNNLVEIDDRPWVDAGSGEQQGTHFIGGGLDNLLINPGDYTVIAGGLVNQISYSGDPYFDADEYIYGDVICGGGSNQILGNGDSSGTTLPRFCGVNFIGSGEANEIDQGFGSIIAGGCYNLIFRESFDTVGSTERGAWFADVISGGVRNRHTLSTRSTIGGGSWNATEGVDSCGIFSGILNRISNTTPNPPFSQDAVFSPGYKPEDPPDDVGIGSAILGGEANRILDGRCSSILGGAFLQIGAGSFGFQCYSTRDFTEIDGASRDWNGDSTEDPQVDLSAFSDIGFFGDVDIWIGNTDNSPRKLKLMAPNTDETYDTTVWSSLRASASQTDVIEYRLPPYQAFAGQSLCLSSVSGSQHETLWSSQVPFDRKTANYTATINDSTLVVDASGGAVTITLPIAGDATRCFFCIKKIDATANAVTIDGDASETIDGALTKVLTVQYDAITIQSDGSNWHIL